MEKEIKEKKNNRRIIVFIIVAFLIGLIYGRIYPLSFKERETSFVNLIKKIEFKDKTLDYNLFLDVLETIKNKYVKQPVSEKDLFYGSLKGLVSGLKDPYSIFLEPELARQFKTELSGTFEGIGAEISEKKGRIVIVAPLEGMPAEKAGLKPGDEIYAINDEDTAGMTVDEAVSKIRGPKGTAVKLLIMRKDWEKPKEFVIIRDTIKIKTVSYKLKENNIVYLRISYFNENTLFEFDKAVREILSFSPRGLILDLRNNPGGYLYAAVEVAGNWLGDKVVVIEKGRENQEVEHRSTRKAKFSNLPTVVLVNRGSASGSEILAGALQDYKVATILGEKTFGKGSVQELVEFKDGSIVKITVAHWLTPNRRQIEERGIEPDVVVEEKSITEEGKDEQLEKAMELLSNLIK